METNFTPWNDQLEIEADAREDVANSFEQNLRTPEEIAEYEEWLSDPDRMEAEMEAIAAGYCPKCGKPFYTREGFCGTCEPHRL